MELAWHFLDQNNVKKWCKYFFLACHPCDISWKRIYARGYAWFDEQDIHLLPLRVFTRAGIENGEQELGEKPHALNFISYQDHGLSRLATYITSIPEYSSSESINSS